MSNNIIDSFDIDIQNTDKIEFIDIALLSDDLDSLYLIKLALNNYFNVYTSNSRELYKLLLKEAINKDVSVIAVLIDILFSEYVKG